MQTYHVTYYYLATGMEGHADERSYGHYDANTAEEAIDMVLEEYFADSSKSDKRFIRGCLTAKLISPVAAPAFISIDPAKAEEEPDVWHAIEQEGAPVGAWIETMREGESGTNVCRCEIHWLGDDPEWIELEGGRTTVTHHSFLPPTHWRWLPETVAIHVVTDEAHR